jgi:DNA-binding HxlR family transcriptional regulator
VLRRVDPGPPVRVGYALTPQGTSFIKVAEAIQAWGQELAKEAAE